MDSNNTHSPNTASDSRPSAVQTLRRFFFVAWRVSPFGAVAQSLLPWVYPYWYPLGKSGIGEPHHSDSCSGNGTEFRDRRALGNRVGLFGTS